MLQFTLTSVSNTNISRENCALKETSVHYQLLWWVLEAKYKGIEHETFGSGRRISLYYQG
jgi:hypothetical protein